MSFAPSCAMVSMRATTSSGVGTQMTSLPAWPTCGSYGLAVWACSGRASIRAAAASAARRARLAIVFPMEERKAYQKSERFRGVVRQSGTLPARERDVARVGPALHAVDDEGEAGTALSEVGRVDLRDVAEAHDLGARAR